MLHFLFIIAHEWFITNSLSGSVIPWQNIFESYWGLKSKFQILILLPYLPYYIFLTASFFSSMKKLSLTCHDLLASMGKTFWYFKLLYNLYNLTFHTPSKVVCFVLCIFPELNTVPASWSGRTWYAPPCSWHLRCLVVPGHTQGILYPWEPRTLGGQRVCRHAVVELGWNVEWTFVKIKVQFRSFWYGMVWLHDTGSDYIVSRIPRNEPKIII